MKTPKVLATCPHCIQAMAASALRRHFCEKAQRVLEKQEWWKAVDKALLGVGLPEMVYAYEVEYLRADGAARKFRCSVDNEKSARRKAVFKTLHKETLSVSPFTYAQYCRCFGEPGSKM